MNCSNCGAELDDGAKFCGECGTKIVRATFCPECGAKCAPGVKFCSECGHKLGLDGSATSGQCSPAKQCVVDQYIDKDCFSMRQLELCEKIDDAIVGALKDAAQNGDGDAIYVLSWYCLTQEDEGKEAALQGFQAGAAQGNAYCKFAVARHLWDDGDCDQAIETYEAAAPKVGVPALWEIAMIIMEGYVDRPWQDALPYFKKIVAMKDRYDWDPLLINSATTLSELIPRVENGDSDAVVKIYRTLVDFEIANRKLGKDPWFGFGIRSITFGSSLGRIMSSYDEVVDGDDECIDDVVRGIKEFKDDPYFGADIEEASDEGSVIAERILNADEEEPSDAKKTADAFFGIDGSQKRNGEDDDNDDDDEMLDDEDEE